MLQSLLAETPATGRTGSDLRTAINTTRVNAKSLLLADQIGPELESVFRLAVTNGIALAQMETVRIAAGGQSATLAGAIAIRDALIQYALAAEGLIIAATTFTSRDDVEATMQSINAAYTPMEETTADAMASMTYMALVAAHGAISYHLQMTAEPLPRMVDFEFATPLPTLVAAYELYADAGRADELRAENHVVHPAFMKATGRALTR